MTHEEALKELKHEIDMLPKEPPSDFVGNENVWFKEHEKIIDAHNKAIEALEKQIPKKPLKIKGVYKDKFICPACKSKEVVTGCDPFIDYGLDYCNNCGQALDWSDNK